jgi:acyl-CoA thioesterase-1
MLTHLLHGGSRRAKLSPAAFVCTVLSATLVNPAPAASPAAAAPVCTLSAPGVDVALTRTRQQLTQGNTLTIVAVGSSSTEGAGASSGSASYPSRLEAMLKRRFAGVEIRVLNRGVGGEEEADMLARFDRDVIA